MKKNILLRTNLLICMIILVGFMLTAMLGYRSNYDSSLQNIEQVSTLISEGVYHRLSSTFSKPVNASLTMASDRLLKDFLSQEPERPDDPAFEETLRNYLNDYRKKYGYDSVFLVSTATNRYYNFNGLDRVLTEGNPENTWYFNMLESGEDYGMEVDNDEVAGAGNQITVFVNCKITDDAGHVMGIMGVGLRISYLQQMLLNYQQNFGVNTYLIDGEGNIQLSANDSGYQAVNLLDAADYTADSWEKILNWHEDGEACSFWETDPSSGEKTDYIVARYLPELRWHLIVERDTGLLMGSLYHQMAQTILIILAITAIVLGVITYVIHTFNRRIVSLTQSIEQERRTVFEQATEQMFENIYELDITNNRPANQVTERYFQSLGAPAGTPFDKVLRIIANKQIKEEFRQGYLDTFLPDHVRQVFEGGRDSLQYEFMISNDGKNYYWMRITARIVRLESDNSIHMLVYRQNIDAEKRQEHRILELTQRDEMTGLLTKTATRRSVERAIKDSDGSLFAFFIFDIDDFKQANDQFGHAFGDRAIRSFADILRKNFRMGDVIGRIGGDEFAAFIPVPNRRWAEEKAKDLLAALNCPQHGDGKDWQMSASIGVAFTSEDNSQYESLYERADSVLYESKRSGKNRYTIEK